MTRQISISFEFHSATFHLLLTSCPPFTSYIQRLLTTTVSTQSLTHIVGFPGETDPLVHRVQLTSTGAPPPAPGGSASASAPSKRGDFGLSAGRRAGSANGGEASTCHLCLRHTTLSLRTLLRCAIYLCSLGGI